MPLPPQLNLYAYEPGTPFESEAELVEELSFTTVAPGGFGDLSCKVRVRDTRIVPTRFQLFNNVALVGSNGFNAFLGRWDEPAIVLDSSDGNLFELKAMGGAHALTDDPEDAAYSSKTMLQIITDQLTGPTGVTPARSGYIPIDQDTTGIVIASPENARTFSPAPNTQTFDQVLSAHLPLVGDYTWGVWDHQTHRDAAGFATWQLQVHKRDASTQDYTAWDDDFISSSVRPSVEWSFNVVQIKYTDATTGAPSSITVSDSRLNASGTQGNAPIPRRKMAKDMSSSRLSSTEAAALANALLAQYQNGGNKIEVVLSRVRDSNGVEIPLWMVRADSNIQLPPYLNIGKALPTTAATNVNLFYIAETKYEETIGQTPQLTLTLASFFDAAAFQIARLQYIAEQRQQDAKVHQVVRAAGEPEIGNCGILWGAVSGAGNSWGHGVNFKTTMTAVPTSITLTQIGASNLNAVGPGSITIHGFQFQATTAAAGNGTAAYTYQTVGN